jgi:hypothetical protein
MRRLCVAITENSSPARGVPNLEDRGTPLARQRFIWRELAGKPISKLDDACTRVRVVLADDWACRCNIGRKRPQP